MLYNLKNLTANDNLFEGSIPSSITNCTRLLVVTLTSNRITGKIPEGLGRLSNLTYLSLGGNNIFGQIPDDLLNCSELEVLDLSLNNLSGTIKQVIGRLVKIRTLKLGHNTFYGSIPREIGNLSALLNLEVHRNRFSGRIPLELSKLTLLQGLSLSDNQLEGEIPQEMSELKQLTYLRLQNNKLVGSIPDAISELEFLSYLNLSGNKLNGTLPKSLERLLRLTTLDLSYNHFTGAVPASTIASMRNLQVYLNLSHNTLNGTVPGEIGKLEMVQEIDLSNNDMSGSIPPELKNCMNLISLDLSSNKLSGELSVDFFPQLNELVRLNFSRNQIYGPLPGTLPSLRHLSVVDLSENKFGGEIPENFSNFSSLKFLNLSFNQLEGCIPQGGVFRNMHLISLQGNPCLSGAICLKRPSNKRNSKTSHQLSKKALLILSALGFVIILIISLSTFYVIRQKKIKECSIEEPENSQPNYTAISTLRRFDAKDLEIATNSFGPDNIIGMSSISTVYKGILEDGHRIAVKKLNLHQFSAESDKCFNREVKTLGQLKHKNLVKVVGYAWESGNLKALVLEFMENGNLDKIIHESEAHLSSWTLTRRIDALVSIANGLVYLHTGYDFPIVHCDLKPSNILLDGKSEAHVSDFGTARILGIQPEDEACISSASVFEGTIGYLAPEFAYLRKVTTKVDIFSFGIIMMELITKRRPTELTGEDGLPITLPQLVQQTLALGINHLPEVLDPLLIPHTSQKHEVLEVLLHLALSCTRPDPENRPDMEQVSSSLSKIRKMA